MELCLGTAQLGMNYGIAGGSKFNHSRALQILNRATELGINIFDTASAYGKAELVLGDFMEAQKKEEIKIVSKCSNNDNSLKHSLMKTLHNLNKSQIDGYLFHDANLLYKSKSVENMICYKDAGYVKNIGVSIYKPEDALYAAKQTWVDYIQIPYNALDQRLDKIDFFEIAKSNNKIIFARSAVLQGLLTMNLEDIRNKLDFAYDNLRKYIKIVNKYNFTQLETAIQYVKSNNKIDYIVFGVYSNDQLNDFANIFNKGHINYEMICDLKREFYDVDERMISPNLW